MTKVTELAIRAKAAVQCPGWRVDFVGPSDGAGGAGTAQS